MKQCTLIRQLTNSEDYKRCEGRWLKVYRPGDNKSTYCRRSRSGPPVKPYSEVLWSVDHDNLRWWLARWYFGSLVENQNAVWKCSYRQNKILTDVDSSYVVTTLRWDNNISRTESKRRTSSRQRCRSPTVIRQYVTDCRTQNVHWYWPESTSGGRSVSGFGGKIVKGLRTSKALQYRSETARPPKVGRLTTYCSPSFRHCRNSGPDTYYSEHMEDSVPIAVSPVDYIYA